MLRIVDMRRTGLYVVMCDGAIASVAGRSYWSNLNELRETLRRERVPHSERVLTTIS
ncbi:MAG TPA: hypothetical protein VEB64_11010 [Azospirillaceae bacterium]|nr:hypothetical protein [Azospirillaceae bacterium]